MRPSIVIGLACFAVACGDGGGGTFVGNNPAPMNPNPGVNGLPNTPTDVPSQPAVMCLGAAAPNLDCPPLEPYDGACAARDSCCRRSSNTAKEALLGPDEPLVLSYRINGTDTLNNPDGAGFSSISQTVEARSNRAAVSVLLQLELPRAGGALTAGAAKLTHGYGRYNCDGTYSFYGPTAAAARTLAGVSSDPARYGPVEQQFDVPAGATPNAALWQAVATLRSQPFRYPVLNDSTFALDWELIERDLLVTDMDMTGAGRDCVGARMGNLWSHGGRYETYYRMDENDVEVIEAINQTYCDLLAFGLASVELVQTTDCLDVSARCMPGSDGCVWKALPDSLCPTTPADEGAYRCHLAATDNPNGESNYPTVSCGPMSPAGPCCDPLGRSTTLPACNAYHLVRDFVAGAVDITRMPATALQTECQ